MKSKDSKSSKKPDEVIEDPKNLIISRMTEWTLPWKLGILENVHHYKKVYYSVYPTDPRRIYCRCITFDNEVEWKWITELKVFNECISGYSLPEFKNSLNFHLRYYKKKLSKSKVKVYSDYINSYKSKFIFWLILNYYRFKSTFTTFN